MTTYVDRFLPMFDKGMWRGGGHLLTTDIDELHRIAAEIGLRAERFYGAMRDYAPHYDLTARMRKRAIAAGAIPIEVGKFPDGLLLKCRDGTYERYVDRRSRTDPDRVERYCVTSGRAVSMISGDRCLHHGAADRPCDTDLRTAQCLHPRLSPNHREPHCEECGKPIPQEFISG